MNEMNLKKISESLQNVVDALEDARQNAIKEISDVAEFIGECELPLHKTSPYGVSGNLLICGIKRIYDRWFIIGQNKNGDRHIMPTTLMDLYDLRSTLAFIRWFAKRQLKQENE